MRTRDLLVDIVVNHYQKAPLELPEDMALREFAIQPLNSPTYVRHLSFRSLSELREFLLSNVPRHLYFSSARYRDPSCSDMQGKGWLGSDLVFDIDADHLPACSDKVVEVRICASCGEVVESSDKKCPRCGSQNLVEIDYVPAECVYVARDEVLKLVDAVEYELGYKTFTIAFSGNRGFHLRVSLSGDDALMTGEMRREIVSYLKLEGIDPTQFMVVERKRKGKRVLTLPPRLTDSGARRRIAKALMNMLNGDSRAQSVVSGRTTSYRDIMEASAAINAVIMDAIRSASIVVDEKVTMDISRLVRVPGSINGKSGWLCKAIPVNKLDSFELSEEEISPIPNTVLEVKLLVPIPKIEVLRSEISGKRGDKLRLNSLEALFLAFKGVAKIINIKR